VQLPATGLWDEVPIAQFDESRAEYAICFFVPTIRRIRRRSTKRSCSTP
jgi:hypothetical protein